jgi:hypothetical protein
MCESGIFGGGYEQRLHDTWKSIRITKKGRDLDANRPYLQPPDRTDRSFSQTRTCSWCIESAGLQATRDLGNTQNGESRLRESQGRAHHRWRRTDVAGFAGQPPAGSVRATASGGGVLSSRAAAQGTREGSRRRRRRARARPPIYGGARAGGGAMRVRMGPARACGGGAGWVGPLARPNPVG